MNTNQINNEDALIKGKDSLWIFLGFLLAIFIVWAISWILIVKYLPDWQNRGSFGDMFGAVNALFSGAALGGVIFAILLQRRELMLQRRELEMTRYELSRTAEAQEKSEKALVQQAEAMALTAKLNALNYLPVATCSFQLGERRVYLSVLNPSNTITFDVDVLVIGVFNEKKIALSTFIEKYVMRNRQELKGLESSEDGDYGVYDRLSFPLIPHGKKITARLVFPEPPDMIYTLLQFRDMQGSNYHQLYWAYREISGDVKDYRIGSIQPVMLTQFPRIEFALEFPSNIQPNLITEDKTPLPNHITKGFLLHWTHSIPPGYMASTVLGPEDRGEWQNI